MYIPNKGELFKSTYRKIILPEKKVSPRETQYVQYLRLVQQVYLGSNLQPQFHSRLSRTHWKALDHAAERCSASLANPDVTACITSHIENHVGCALPIQGANLTMAQCTTSDSIHKFLAINRFLISAQWSLNVLTMTHLIRCCKLLLCPQGRWRPWTKAGSSG